MNSRGINPNGAGSVSMEEFIRTRDSVVTGLTKLNGAIGTLISAYVTHTNTLLNGAGQEQAVLDPNVLTDYLVNVGLAAPKGDGEPAGKDKKKKPKKEKDPNAPKRPLTAFFLFSTRARDHIKSDLGPEATPVQINAEILRRWNDMEAVQKDRWKEIYNQNYEEYKKEAEAYRIKTGKDVAVEAAVDHEAPSDPTQLNATAAAVQSEASDDSSDEEAEPEPPKEPTPPPAKKAKAPAKGKKKGAAAAAPPAASPSPSAQLTAGARSTTDIPLPTPEKRKKSAKEESPEVPKKKKARKSETAAAPAPAPTPAAAAPEKKKGKKGKKGE